MALVVLAMSGGVDSSVAAQLLLAAGHDVVGVFLRHGVAVDTACRQAAGDVAALLPIIPSVEDPAFHKQGCCTAQDAEDARAVAQRLGIDFYALNLQQDFDRIMDYFAAEYTSGRTPNPCVMCNHWIKFGKLFEYADSIGAPYVATGHYARIGGTPDAPALLRGVDGQKDQSYVLFGIDKTLLPRMMLPVGEFEKPEIRRQATELGLLTADKRDSQEICFVSPGQHADFVIRRAGDHDSSGNIVTTEGNVVGRHNGIERFTIGQRKGIGVALGDPHYVVRIDAESKDVIVGPHAALARHQLTASDANWFVDLAADLPARARARACGAQIRYNSGAQPATVGILSDRRFQVTFDEPCFGVAPGQAVVCYDGDRVLGGGWID
jgi:tRNA-specific 2-thiouridylase